MTTSRQGTAPADPTLNPIERALALGGVAGVGGFVAAWAVLGATREGYSPVSDAISRLAEVGTENRGYMNLGFSAFGVGLPLYSMALRAALPGKAWTAALTTGLASFGVAAAPLGRFDAAHYVFATLGYVTLAATPLLAVQDFARAGLDRRAKVSRIVAAASGLFMVASIVDPGHGLTQRLGLGISDMWIVVTAIAMWRKGALLRRSERPE